MERSKVYQLIDGERAYQDAKWGTLEQNPHTIDEWLDLITEEVDEVERCLTLNTALDELRQVAALAIAALEQYGCPPREGYEASHEQPAPAVAVPDWANAPAWAMWWAVDPDGRAYWFEGKPYIDDCEWWDGIVTERHHATFMGDVDLPLGTDWRQTLQARPQPPQEPTR